MSSMLLLLAAASCAADQNVQKDGIEECPPIVLELLGIDTKIPNTMRVFQTSYGCFRVVSCWGRYSKNPFGKGKGERRHDMIQLPGGHWIRGCPRTSLNDIKGVYKGNGGGECLVFESSIQGYIWDIAPFPVNQERLVALYFTPEGLKISGVIVGDVYLEVVKRDVPVFAGLVYYNKDLGKFVFVEYTGTASGTIATYRSERKGEFILYLRNGGKEFQKVAFDAIHRKFSKPPGPESLVLSHQ